MNILFLKSIREAKYLIYQIQDSAHDIVHVKGVVETALDICKNYGDVNFSVIEVASWWHDIGRLYQEDHEELSAKMAYNSLKNLGVVESICQKVFDAIVFHKRSMYPKTLEGEILRDADKLDFISIIRRKQCIKNQNYNALYDISRLIPLLKNILHLDISKNILDKRLILFYEYINNQQNKEIDYIKKLLIK